MQPSFIERLANVPCERIDEYEQQRPRSMDAQWMPRRHVCRPVSSLG